MVHDIMSELKGLFNGHFDSRILTREIKDEICEKIMKNNNGLRQHFKIIHNFVKGHEHQCNICQKVFKLHT